MRYLFAIKSIDETLIYSLSELSLTICSIRNVELSCEFYYKYNFGRSLRPFKLDIFTVLRQSGIPSKKPEEINE